MVAEHISDVVGLPSLADVLCTLAANWVLCECGKKIKEVGIDGWAKKGLGLGEKIDLLNAQIPVIESPSRKKAMQADLAKLEAQSKALNEEWGQAYDEADACCELFWNAREFCTRACGIGDNEVFNAALVGFDPTRLQPGQDPSKPRMLKIASLLRSLPRDEWKTQPWANPTKPTMSAARRVASDRLNSFIVRNLKHVGTVSGPSGQGNPLKGLNADANPDQQVPEKWLSPRSVAGLVKETGCSRTTINSDVKNGNIPGGALRENNKPRGNVILQQNGLDYLKRKGGKDKKDQR